MLWMTSRRDRIRRGVLVRWEGQGEDGQHFFCSYIKLLSFGPFISSMYFRDNMWLLKFSSAKLGHCYLLACQVVVCSETAIWVRHALLLITKVRLWNQHLRYFSKKGQVGLGELAHLYPVSLFPVPPNCQMAAAGYESVRPVFITLNSAPRSLSFWGGLSLEHAHPLLVKESPQKKIQVIGSSF